MNVPRLRPSLAALAISTASALSSAPLGAQGAQGLHKDIHPARVWTVNALGGADFFDMPRAVDTARPGDVLLVAPGLDYSAFELRGKGLTILGDGGIPRINGSSLVQGVPPQQVVCLRSLEFKDSTDEMPPALRLRSNAGTVWIEDCTIHRPGFPLTSGGDDPAVLAEDCADVLFVRSQVIGSITGARPFTPPAGAGLHALRSDVHAYESVFQGVNIIQNTSSGSGQDLLGGNGATLVDSTLHAAGSTFRGGQGQSALWSSFGGFCVQVAQRGGAGLHAAMASAPPVILDCTLQGGPGGGPSSNGFCPGAPAGPASVGTLQVEDLPLRSYELESPVRDGTSYQLTAVCEPGEFVWSAFAESLDPFYLPNYFGTQVGALPVELVFEGVADGSGTVSKSVPVPPLAALVRFERLYAQGLFFDEFNNAYLGSPSVLVVVD